MADSSPILAEMPPPGRVTGLRARVMTRVARLLEQPAARNVGRMLAGNASAQLLTFLAYPILTRLYSPHEMGLLSVASSAVLVMAPLAALRMEMALPIARSKAEAGGTLVVCLMALLLTSSALTLALFLAPQAWLQALGDMRPYRYYLPLAMLAFGGYVVAVYEATRQDMFADIARTRVYQAIAGPLVQIGAALAALAGLFSVGAHGLLAGFVIGQGSGTLGLAKRMFTGAGSPLRGVTWQDVRSSLVKHRNYALFSSWTSAITSASTNAMPIAFAFIFGPAVSGLIFLSDRVLMRPLLLVTSSVLPVYLRELAQVQQHAPAGMASLFRSVVLKTAALSLLWIVPVVIAAPWIIPKVFGQEWEPAVRYVQVMAISYFPASLMNPVLNTLQILERQKTAAALDMLRAALVFGSIAWVAMAAATHSVTALQATLICSATLAVTHSAALLFTYAVIRKASRIAADAAAALSPSSSTVSPPTRSFEGKQP